MCCPKGTFCLCLQPATRSGSGTAAPRGKGEAPSPAGGHLCTLWTQTKPSTVPPPLQRLSRGGGPLLPAPQPLNIPGLEQKPPRGQKPALIAQLGFG